MKILAFETSCDDTAVALVENGHNILANITASQTEIHQKYGGVVPEIAARNHINIIIQLIDEAIKKSNYHLKDIDAFAATAFHGLSGSLLIGMMTAKTLSYIYSKPSLFRSRASAWYFKNLSFCLNSAVSSTNASPRFIRWAFRWVRFFKYK